MNKLSSKPTYIILAIFMWCPYKRSKNPSHKTFITKWLWLIGQSIMYPIYEIYIIKQPQFHFNRQRITSIGFLSGIWFELFRKWLFCFWSYAKAIKESQNTKYKAHSSVRVLKRRLNEDRWLIMGLHMNRILVFFKNSINKRTVVEFQWISRPFT